LEYLLLIIGINLDLNNNLILVSEIDFNQMGLWGLKNFTLPESKKIDLKKV
jgi:hypothetical protein